MNQAHIHLLITHLPILGSILGGLVLAHGIWTKCHQTKIAAYLVFLLSGIGAGVAYLTGEAAEETVENLQGVAKNMIDAHEDFAVYALISLMVLTAAAMVGLFLTLRKSPLTSIAAIVILFISLISFSLVARTGYLGGQIRHTEINSANTTTPEPEKADEDDD